MPNTRKNTSLCCFYTLIECCALNFIAFTVTPNHCMAPSLQMAWQQTLHPFRLALVWILGLVTTWILDYENKITLLVVCASPCMVATMHQN